MRQILVLRNTRGCFFCFGFSAQVISLLTIRFGYILSILAL